MFYQLCNMPVPQISLGRGSHLFRKVLIYCSDLLAWSFSTRSLAGAVSHWEDCALPAFTLRQFPSKRTASGMPCIHLPLMELRKVGGGGGGLGSPLWTDSDGWTARIQRRCHLLSIYLERRSRLCIQNKLAPSKQRLAAARGLSGALMLPTLMGS